MSTSERYQHYIDGNWCDSESGQTYDAINPATEQPFGKVPRGTRADVRRAVDAATRAAKTWSKVPLWERAGFCMKIAEALSQRREELADILTTELGKPRHGEAKDEAFWTPKHCQLAAEQAKYLEGSTIPVQDRNKRVLSIRQPRGVVGIITPWNFPAAIPCEYLPFAIVMGNTVVWTPAPTAAVTAIKLMEAIADTGLPAGVINLVTGPGNEVGDEIVVNPGTHALGMTGSTATARIIVSRAGLKPTLMELGGNGPTIVLDDADPVAAARAIAPTCFYAAGQVCVSAERILVADNLKRAFTDEMANQTRNWILGDPWDAKVTMGPQNNAGVVQKMTRHLADARERGAKVVVGGNRPNRPGYFYEPTVLTDFPPEAMINLEETFGPVAPIAGFKSDDQAWDYINACPLGLTSAVFTRDVSRAWRWAENLRTGIVVVNDGQFFWEPHMPFGGIGGHSGLGRLGGRHTLEFMSDLKTIAFHVGE